MRHTHFVAGVIAALVLCASATAVALGAGSTSAPSDAPARTVSATSDRVPEPRSIATADLSEFFVGLRAGTEVLPPPSSPLASHATAGGDRSRVHVVFAADDPIFLDASARGFCVGTGQSMGCTTRSGALSGRAVVVDLCGPDIPNGSVRVYGVLPDGANSVSLMFARGGAGLPVGLHDGGFDVVTSAVPTGLAWGSADGGAHLTPLPLPPGEEPCRS